MTTDISIGEIKILTWNEWFEKYKNRIDDINLNYIYNFINIEQMPDEEDGCNIEWTITPNQAYRSGSWALSKFFDLYLPDVIEIWRPVNSNDFQIGLIKPFINEINSLPDIADDECSTDRIKWLKFWCNKAVEKYDIKAGISFS